MSMSTFGISFCSLLGVAVLSVLALLSQYSELDCEENKLEVRLFNKQYNSLVYRNHW